ncbi:hypothetical protein [Elizabethkingia ursingii]|uniref:hypothetical protein n=1 Tax=Elizabethkingia ursingii TaxID=1756150 RepID=UPI0007512D30|nr:hypothetical protein [Elizabethkingia ursingii]KUY29533.1 hypothetical protein ATB96_02380 [Elizabethkingia ursingii]
MANPFKDINELERDIETFLRRNNGRIFNNAKRISDFFEMACYNNIVRFYENNGFSIQIKNLIKQKFNYKCTTAGNPANYSYFQISKGNLTYEIRHNINIQSKHINDIYTTPDICILKPSSIKVDNDFYETRKSYYYAENKSLVSFCEVKNFNPYPELLFNFIGTVNELKPILTKKPLKSGKSHIATSLMMSGKANKHSKKIIFHLQNRYHVNIIDDLFNISGAVFNKKAIRKLKTV